MMTARYRQTTSLISQQTRRRGTEPVESKLIYIKLTRTYLPMSRVVQSNFGLACLMPVVAAWHLFIMTNFLLEYIE